MMTKKALLKIKGLSETKVDKIKEAAIKSQASNSLYIYPNYKITHTHRVQDL
jgi:hypothetical protein